MRANRSRASEARTCPESGKVRYRSQADARLALRAFAAKKVANFYTPRNAYECDDCGGWHLTHLHQEAHAEAYRPDGLSAVIAATFKESAMPNDAAVFSRSLVERIGALLKEEYDVTRAVLALNLPNGRTCQTCFNPVTCELGDDEITIRAFALVGDGALCLGTDCETDATLAGWWVPDPELRSESCSMFDAGDVV
jgi:hypothetical protein